MIQGAVGSTLAQMSKVHPYAFAACLASRVGAALCTNCHHPSSLASQGSFRDAIIVSLSQLGPAQDQGPRAEEMREINNSLDSASVGHPRARSHGESRQEIRCSRFQQSTAALHQPPTVLANPCPAFLQVMHLGSVDLLHPCVRWRQLVGEGQRVQSAAAISPLTLERRVSSCKTGDNVFVIICEC
jgi:hypothetical protein